MEDVKTALTIDEQIAAQPAIIETARKNYLAVGAKEGVTDAEIEEAYGAWQWAKKDLVKLENAKKLEEAAAKLAEIRNVELAKVQALLDAHDAMKAVEADKKATVEQKQAASEVLKAARTAVENRMIPNHAAPKAATTTGGGTPRAAGGESKSERYRKLANEMFEAGKTGAEVRAAAKELPEYNDGTANAAIISVERARGLRD